MKGLCYQILSILFLFCSGCNIHSREDQDKRIEAVILTDYAVHDTAYAYSAFFQLDQKATTDTCNLLNAVGFVSTTLTGTNIVYEDLYGCQQSFPAVRVPLTINPSQYGEIKSYWKIDFHGIKNYHDVNMIKKIHSEFFESDFTLITSETPGTEIKKKDDFAVYYYKYDTLIRLE